MPVMTPANCAEAADMFRRLVDAVFNGDLDADTSQGRVLLRHMEGAAEALQVVANAPRRRRS